MEKRRVPLTVYYYTTYSLFLKLMDRFESQFLLIRNNWIDLVSCKFWLFILWKTIQLYIRSISYTSVVYLTDFMIVENKNKFDYQLIETVCNRQSSISVPLSKWPNHELIQLIFRDARNYKPLIRFYVIIRYFPRTPWRRTRGRIGGARGWREGHANRGARKSNGLSQALDGKRWSETEKIVIPPDRSVK